MSTLPSRRLFLTLAAGAAVAGCTTTTDKTPTEKGTKTRRKGSRKYASQNRPLEDYALMYAGKSDGGYDLPPVPYKKLNDRFLRQYVRNTTGEKAGTLVVDTKKKMLYYTYPNGQAIRYGVGLGRAGFEWSGRAIMQWKRKWPTWTPPAEMIERQPELEKYSAENGGMEPGLKNPLGARALYIFQNGKDTLYRLHGSPEWASIGTAASSGCVRLMNQDVIDLYTRVPSGTPIVVK